ncbi:MULTISPECIES: DKNYY domain-containing protein [Burkholderia]|uniref:Uncharacterized protein n=1 Tax=Burkholderia aenigmatica TaxID=2015348 RepID=A0ABY6Y4T7_9BURK|nr:MULTISPECIES: DKNYY domain-containing protein [Burkholderia]VWD36278.1 hypothetical protein BLA17378_07705 [Burkholderia aenigmatica]VWD54991.1 hypothetical protein BLA18628_06471 [Burkholderia aenigmatica]
MAEPLFVLADVEISEAALRRWLKSAPLSAKAFDDWPGSVYRGDSGISQAAPSADLSVADGLVAYCVGSFGLGDSHLHCNYDKQAKALRFAVYFQYGDEAGVMESALSFCALLRGIAETYTAKTPSFIRLFDTGTNILCIEISQKASRIVPDPVNAQLSPEWFDEWISQENFGDPDTLLAALFPPLARALKKQVALGALRASPQAPYDYDRFFWTDGEHVYGGSSDDPVVKNADPKTFRRVTPANAMDSAFYADACQIWYHQPMVDVVPVQSLESGASMQGWRPFSSDGEPLLRCGDTAWTVANMDYPDGGSVFGHADYPNGGNTKGNVRSVLRNIQAQGGIPVWEKIYNFEYLRPTQVEGASFVHVKDGLFEDGKSVYVQTDRGLIRMEGAVPGMTTYLGGLCCNNGRFFRKGCAIKRQLDAATLRNLDYDLYADNRHVYQLRDGSDGHEFSPDLHILRDAEPADFRIMCALPNATISADTRHVWLNGEVIPGSTPEAVKFMGSFFWTDGNRVYNCEKLIQDADPKQFDVLADSDYARQGKVVYFRAEQIPDADAASFVADGGTAAHDRHRRYEFERPVEPRDSES